MSSKPSVTAQFELSGRHLNCTQAERLGFSYKSAFAKACRRWSSMTPGQFRQGLAE